MTRRESRERAFRFVLEITRPVAFGVFWMLDKIYAVFLRPGDLRRTRERNEEFGRDVESGLSFLFTEYGGVLNSYTVKEPHLFDGAAVRVALPEFILHFSIGRGDVEVLIAPRHAPDEKLQLSKLLSIIDKPFEQRAFRSFADVRGVLEPRMALLRDALCPDRYPEWRRWLPFAASQRELKRPV